MITYKIAIRMNHLNSNKNNTIFNFFKKKTALTVVNPIIYPIINVKFV